MTFSFLLAGEIDYYGDLLVWTKNPILKVSDTIEVTDKNSRVAHNYTAFE